MDYFKLRAGNEACVIVLYLMGKSNNKRLAVIYIVWWRGFDGKKESLGRELYARSGVLRVVFIVI